VTTASREPLNDFLAYL